MCLATLYPSTILHSPVSFRLHLLHSLLHRTQPTHLHLLPHLYVTLCFSLCLKYILTIANSILLAKFITICPVTFLSPTPYTCPSPPHHLCSFYQRAHWSSLQPPLFLPWVHSPLLHLPHPGIFFLLHLTSNLRGICSCNVYHGKRIIRYRTWIDIEERRLLMPPNNHLS